MTALKFPTYKTLSLYERVAQAATPKSVDKVQGERRFKRWAETEPFEQEDLFDRRLAQDSLDREGLRQLLRQDVEEAWSEHPAWAKIVVDCLSLAASKQERLSPPDHWRRISSFPFWGFVEPLARRAVRLLLADVRELITLHPEGPLDEERISTLIVDCLPLELLSWPFRTLVLELNIARLSGQLTQDDPRERFLAFTKDLENGNAAMSLLEQYPVLARQLIEHLETWREATLELLQRLCEDWESIFALFGNISAKDRLKQVNLGAGDGHRGGRTVALLTFDSGTKLVYKPRSLAIDVYFQALLEQLNEWGQEPALKTLCLLDRGSHGWVEHLATRPCQSADEVERFYQRQGAYLAILYMLCATDIHFENLIAVGEHPFIIDLESLMQPGPPLDDPLANDLLRNSIVEVGLLPVRNWENETSAGLDVSGLGGPDGQTAPRPEPFWANSGTDEMHYSRQVKEIKARSHHRPSLDGQPVSALDHADEIVRGFESLYRLVLTHQPEVLAEDGILAGFGQVEARILLRPTAVYGLMLRESFHPDFLRDCLDRDRFFDKLWKQVPHRPFLQRVIPSEQHALRLRDIPMFTAHTSSRSLILDSGEPLDDFFSLSSIERLRQRVSGFGLQDLEKQVWFIRASLSILSTADPERDAHARRQPRAGLPAKVSPARLQDLALKIADQICEQAMPEEDGIRWVGLQPASQGAFKISYLGNSLYSGQAGVTLFLAYAAHLGGNSRHLRLAEQSCRTLLVQLGDDEQRSDSPGVFEGLSGAIYLLTHLAALWQRDSLYDKALELIEYLPPLIEEDEMLDIINGSAGAILALSALYRRRPEPAVLAVMVSCADRLVAQSVVMDEGCGWSTNHESRVPLTGFSHGGAGIAAALFEVFAKSGDSRFREKALEALRYERSHFSQEEGNWPDLRHEKALYDQVNWCHGAPGAAVARALILSHEDSPELRQEVRAAAQTTLDSGFGRNHSLCHGDLGNLDALLTANDSLPDLDLRADIDRLAAEIADDIEHHGCRCGLPMGVETPGLMVGLAGIGHGLLRLAAPNQVPSVLSLAPPPEAK